MRTHKAILNFLASIFRNGIGLLLGIITTPIILQYLGEEQFAIFRILLDWFANLSLFEFGLYGALLSFFSKILGEKKKKLGVALQLMFMKYTHVLVGEIMALVVFALFYPYLVPVSAENQGEAWWSFVILSTSTLLIYSQIFRARLEASQRGYIVSYIMVAQNILYLSLALCFVYWGYGVIGQVISYVISLIFMFVLYLYFCREDIPLFFSQDILVQEDLHLFKKQRKNIFFVDLFGRASLMSDNLIITFILGAKSVTPFFLTQRLAQMIQLQLQHISNSTWPAIGDLYYKNQRELLNRRILELTEITAWLSGICLGALIISNKAFIFLWTGEATYSGNMTTILACINAGLFSVTSLWSWCFSAVNRSDKVVPVFFVQSMVNIIGSFIFTYALGVNGPLIGTFLGLGVIAVWWEGKVLCEIFGIGYLILMRKWIIPFLLPVISMTVVYKYLYAPVVSHWIEFFLLYIGSAGAIAIFSTLFFLHRDTRQLCVDKTVHFLVKFGR